MHTSQQTQRWPAYAAVSAAAYAAVLVPFCMLQQGNAVVLIRPADGVGPALGLVLGWPAVAGCAAAWLAVQMFMGATETWLLAVGLAAQLAYLALPRAIWLVAAALARRYAARQAASSRATSHVPVGGWENVPRLDTTGKVAVYLIAAFADAVLAQLLVARIDVARMPELEGALDIAFYHAFVFLMYVGLPIVLALSRRLAGPSTSAVAARGARPAQGAHGGVALGELMVMTFLAAIALLAFVFYALTYLVYILDGTFTTVDEYLLLVRTFYVIVTQLTPAGFVVMLVAVHALGRRATKPIEALTYTTSTFVERLAARDETGGVLAIEQVDERGMAPAIEVRDLMDAAETMQRDLVSYISRLETVTAERERVEAELDIARNIQASAIPHDFAAQAAHGIAIEGLMRPAREVGGDFYDVFDLDESRTAFVVGDVSGKGVPAALFMMRALGIIRSCVMTEPDIGRALATANDGLVERNDAMLFVTAFVCVLDRRTGTLSYANAGHNPPSLRRAGLRTFLRARPGLVLGCMEGVPYEAVAISFAPDDEFTLYTDGVTEASNDAGALFGEERLAAELAALDAQDSCTCAASGPDAGTGGDAMPSQTAAVLQAIDRFVGDAPQADDITLLRMRWELPVARLELVSDESEFPRLVDLLEGFVMRLPAQHAATAADKAGARDVCGEEAVDLASDAGAVARTPILSLDDAQRKRLLFNLQLVAEELFVNVCRYGHPDASAVPVRIALAYDDDLGTVHLMMEDAGIAYNPLEHRVAMPTPEGPIGGLGVHLVRQLSEHVAYERRGDWNTIHLTMPATGGHRAS